jgi:hypothetical protein
VAAQTTAANDPWKTGNPEMNRARAQASAPQGAGPFGRVQAPGAIAPGGDAVLDNMKKPGQAYQQLLSHPRDPGAALNTLVNGASDTEADANRSRVLNALGSYVGLPNLGKNPNAVAKAVTDAWFDPTTLLGGSGLIEKGANALGRTAYIGAAKGMAQANPISKVAAGIHDFVTPGGAEMGALKRTLAAKDGRKGLDTYVTARSAAKGAQNAGTDKVKAVNDALGTAPEPAPKPAAPPPKKPHFTAAEVAATLKRKNQPEIFGPATTNVNAPLKNPAASGQIGAVDETTGEFIPRTLHQVASISANKPARIRNWPVAGDLTAPQSADPVWEYADAFKPKMHAAPDSRVAQIAQGASKNAKAITKGTTDLMFAAPQLPLMEGHGSNVLQTGILSDPATAIPALARFAASGEAIPVSAIRNAVQKLPGVRGLKAAQDASVARANTSGANTVHPEDFGSGGWLSKVPGIGMAARESNRGLQAWDAALKGSLNDTFTRGFEDAGHTPQVAAAKAADRVGQDVVDYSDKSDLTRALQHGLPFATYATKKPGIIARAALRHPERVLAMTRDNPNYEQRDEPMTYPDQGRPLASVFNAMNNKSPAAKGGAPYPGAQYQRASQGAALNDLLGAANPYFTYGPPAKHAEGNLPLGVLKLLLSQTVGNVTGGDQLLNATGLNYFGDK